MLVVLRAILGMIVRKGTLEVESWSGSRFIVGDGSGERVAVYLADSGAVWQLILRPGLALGELYVDGRLVVTRGSIHELMMLLGHNLASQSWPWIGRADHRLRVALRPLHQHNTARRARRNAAHHYDLDGRLYSLFLDADMQYSCAYFEYPGQSLKEAQLAKKRHIAAKLLVEPGHRVLDIGSGWGGLVFYLAESFGAKGYRISHADELLPTLKAALDDDGVSLICCPVDYSENLRLTDRLGELDETL